VSAVPVLTERTDSGFSAWSPDLPGCIATGDSEEEARERMAAAVAMHVEALRKAGRAVPDASGPAAG
jgi:predicted RNase H-like HicB family nuclease